MLFMLKCLQQPGRKTQALRAGSGSSSSGSDNKSETPKAHRVPHRPLRAPSPQGVKKLLSSCVGLGAARPDLRRAMSLRSVDVMATRLWFDRKVCAVCSRTSVHFAVCFRTRYVCTRAQAVQ